MICQEGLSGLAEHLNQRGVGTQPAGMTIDVVDVAAIGSLHQITGTLHEQYLNNYVQMDYIFHDKRTKIINGEVVENIKENITGTKTWYAIHCNLPQN